MSGYTLLSANSRYQIDKTWTIEVSGTNLANRDYVLARGYNQPGRTIFVTVRALAF